MSFLTNNVFNYIDELGDKEIFGGSCFNIFILKRNYMNFHFFMTLLSLE